MLLRSGEMSALLADVIVVAQQAGDAIRGVELGGNWTVRHKDDRSALTEADQLAETLIADGLRTIDPHTPVISEEGRCAIGAGVPERFWLVDPLDGTREFIAGNGEYTVNIALVESGEPVLGVVHVPARGITYAAARGEGAVCIDAGATRSIRACTNGELVVVASRSHAGPSLGAFLEALPPHRTMAMGSALKICLVADGTAQLYPRLGPTCWWDTAAGHAIALECGATLTTLEGAPLRYAGTDILNPSFVCASVPRTVWQHAAEAALSASR